MSNKNKANKYNQLSWLIKIFFITFFLSIIFNYTSSSLVQSLSILPSIIILVFIIFIGVISDLISTAVTAADEAPFHAKAADKKRGAYMCPKLPRTWLKVKACRWRH
jgi:c-di-AMP phosphodiesterase-like protein